MGGVINYIDRNLKSDIIIDLQIVDDDEDCGTNYSPLAIGEWPGTIKGCNCNGLSFYCSKVC